MTLTQLQQDLIFGSVLGDANLQSESGGKTWRYRAAALLDGGCFAGQKEYLFHKYTILQPLCGPGTTPIEKDTLDSRTGKTYKGWMFNTLTQPELKVFGDMFYTYDSIQKKWVKDVPLKVESFLTPQALAYFYMDDGALKWEGHSNAMRICTESFTPEGVKRIQGALKNLYNIETTTTKKLIKGDSVVGLRIAIPEKSSADFRELIKPFLVDCMKYKVSDGKRGHL
jgi:hypothetical protein